MQHQFQISAINPASSTHFFAMSDRELAKHHACRVTADANPGFPCRVSLQDAELGEILILFKYCHHDVASPYRATGPVFVRQHAQAAKLRLNELPGHLAHRQLSMRGYSEKAMLVAARVCPGDTLAAEIQQLLENTQVQYIHIHNAAQGCYHCQVDRVD